MPKQKTAKQLDKTLWDWFSKYIRLKYADEYGMVSCVTCGERHRWKELHAGHFVTRDRKIHKFSEKNVHPQCVKCNSYHSGEQFKHGQYIDAKYGDGFAQWLIDTSVQPHKRTAYDYEQLIIEFKQKAKEQAERVGTKL